MSSNFHSVYPLVVSGHCRLFTLHKTSIWPARIDPQLQLLLNDYKAKCPVMAKQQIQSIIPYTSVPGPAVGNPCLHGEKTASVKYAETTRLLRSQSRLQLSLAMLELCWQPWGRWREALVVVWFSLSLPDWQLLHSNNQPSSNDGAARSEFPFEIVTIFLQNTLNV